MELDKVPINGILFDFSKDDTYTAKGSYGE